MLMAALEANNRNDGAGRIREGEETLLVRAEGAIRNLDDVRAIVLRGEGGVVRVGDVAAVRIGALTRYGAVTRNGEGEAVEGLVLGLRGANARQLVREVRATLDALGPTLPPGVSIVPFYDRGQLVDRAVGTVTKALGEAIVLVLILLLLFLGNLRAALAVALILPLSALATFVLMQQWGLSANLMSLGGLAIAIGMLVDAAVVVVENIEARQSSLHGPALALPNRHHVFRATAEVAQPVGAGVAIIMIVFLPLLTLQGLEGKLFSPVALTIVFALGASLLLSLTVIPALASWLLRLPQPGHKPHQAPWLVRRLEALYTPLLDWALGHGKSVVLGSVLAFMSRPPKATRPLVSSPAALRMNMPMSASRSCPSKRAETRCSTRGSSSSALTGMTVSGVSTNCPGACSTCSTSDKRLAWMRVGSNFRSCGMAGWMSETLRGPVDWVNCAGTSWAAAHRPSAASSSARSARGQARGWRTTSRFRARAESHAAMKPMP